MKPQNQMEALLQHLQKRPITSIEAIQKYGITRLSAKIFNLRERGVLIYSETNISKNRYGQKVRFCTYYLCKTKADYKKLERKSK